MASNIINPAAAANAYAKMGGAATMPQTETVGQPKFTDFMKDTVLSSMGTLKAGETAAAQAVTGGASLPEVVQAVNAAEMTLKTVTAVRDKLINAYQEMMRMPI